MEVELITATETLDDVEEIARHRALAKELGLTKQADLNTSDTTTLAPQITEEQKLVYETCFPDKVDIENYANDMIPARVLEHYRDVRDHYKKVQVWHCKGHPDPLLIGITQDPENTWRDYLHLIARWGEALVPYSELREQCGKMLREYNVAEAAKMKAKAEAFLAEAKTVSDEAFITGGVHFSRY